jgi:PKD repeat protein
MRYQDNHGAWSDWSDETSFTTAALSFDYSPINPFVGEQVTFTVSNYPPGAICEWDFGDGSPVLREEAWRGATHSYENAGLYTVTLTLTDQNGKQSITSGQLKISNDELIASLKVSNQQPKMSEEIVLDASDSHNLNLRVRITYYKWEFFDTKGAKIKEGSTNSPIIFYYWKNEGDYSVRLTVENENGLTAVTSATIHVQGKHFWEDWFKDRPEIDEQRLDEIISSLGLNFEDKKELAAILYKPVANKEILTGAIENKEDAVAYTYAAKVALTLGEMEMVQDVLTWQANIDLTQRIDAYLPYIATLEAVKQIATIIIDAGLEGLGWIGVVISGVKEAVDVGWSVADIERMIPTLGIWKKAEYYNALRQYLQLRSEGRIHSEAWNDPLVVYSFTIYTQDERNAIELSFKHLGDTYAQYVTNYDLQEDFMNQVKEGLKTELLHALEQYRFEPLYEQVKIKSVGELRVYDPLNRVTGLVNGQIRQEIPLSFYDEENETVVIFEPSDMYLYEVVGEDEGTYGLEITSVEYGNTTIFTATDIPTSPGATHQYTVDWDALSLGEEGVTVQVDSDGDGVFEHTFTSDSELTQTEYVIATDKTPPVTTLSIGEPKYVTEITYVTPDTPFTLEATDDAGSGVHSIAYRIYNSAYDSGWLPYTEPSNLTALDDGVYTIEFNSTDYAGNIEATKSIQVTLFSWNYVFEDSYGRGTMLKINIEHKFFQFITPDGDYGIRKATRMQVYRARFIIIQHRDDELRLITLTIDTKLDFCVAIAWDVETSTRYFLIDKPGKE